MNFIPYNATENGGGPEYRRPSRERAEAMSMHLYHHGILAKLRQSAGQDIAGACGQLRARSIARAA
jgi:23S rRNA (adenine2503-C2)-methyltransferase